MSAAVVEVPVPEPKKRKSNRARDRVSTLLRPHIRMRMDRIQQEEGVDSQMSMLRQLVLEALAARGFSEHTLLADWHEEVSAALREGKKHPYSIDAI